MIMYQLNLSVSPKQIKAPFYLCAIWNYQTASVSFNI